MRQLISLIWLAAPLTVPAAVEFSRDVQPILSETCYQCHGPDAKARKAKLRLDTREGAFREADGVKVVAPGDPVNSELYGRITHADPGERMPPPDSKLELSPEKIAVLKQWIEEGAPWGKHWAFEPPARPDVPNIANARVPVRNAIDAFLLKRLERESLTMSPEADRRTLARRLSLDLTGLPPAPKEVEAFVNDTAKDAYEKFVGRLLDKPAYGERMAWDWLDAARYADSNGYQGDRERTMWPWRDWVVRAFNKNLPFDRFTVWQLAGDLLPDATLEQKLATGFNRNHMINGEGGRIAAENRVDYVMDMTETMGTVWMGLTLNCCRCHDHKFDQLRQRDYYQLFAFFNQTPVNGGGGDPQTAPNLAVPPPDVQQRKDALNEQIAGFDREREAREKSLGEARRAWEQNVLKDHAVPAWSALVPFSMKAQHQQLKVLDDQTILAGGPNPKNDTYTLSFTNRAEKLTGIRIETLRHSTMTKNGLARSDSGNYVLTEFDVSIARGETSEALPFASASASFEQPNHPITHTWDGNKGSGWAVHEGRNVDREHEAVWRFKNPVENAAGAVITVVMRHDSPHAAHNIGRFRLSVTGVESPQLAGAAAVLAELLRVPEDQRTKEQQDRLAQAFRAQDATLVALRGRRDAAVKERDGLGKNLPKVMIMQDMDKPRKTFMLKGGAYNQPDEEVFAAVPPVLPELPDGVVTNRLALARWLIAPDHPLTARVIVNRFWQQFFGIGLVRTSEDFGVQGERPVHPELLDWLAVEFRESGWDVKALVRLMLTSHAYRQASKVTPAQVARDPQNRLLARAPRYRMPSWMLRDQALAVSGLLEPRLGGPPVNTYQPAGVWEEFTFGNKRYRRDSGDKLYRRSLYTFWRRIIAPTMFFDIASRQTCTVTPFRTNTPLHALLTLNDVSYVEAARMFAQSLLLEQGDDGAHLEQAFRRLLARPPAPAERAVLLGGLERSRKEFAANPDGAEQLISMGESKRDEKLDAVDHAAWTSLCLALLNLDESLTRE